jgi:hypothetical protein
MKPFRHYTLLIATGLLLASCASDSKSDPDSPSPSTDNRDKYVAHWNVSENSALIGGTTSHTVNITKSASLSSDILIANFYGMPSSSVRATVNNNSFTIPYQAVPGGFVVGGSGTLSSSTVINLTYTTAIGTDRDSCSATYVKQ